MISKYDAILVVSFGGPEKMDDVIPFLENVLRGRNVPRERLLEVAHHYELFGGVSPINAQVRELMVALRPELDSHGINLPMYWGNRNWHPLLANTMRQMERDGVKQALAFVTSAFSSYSGCRQYREDIERARAEVGLDAPQVDKLRSFFNHPKFIGALVERMRDALEQIPIGRHEKVEIVFTAHSIPVSTANGSPYEAQLKEACRLVSAGLQWPTGRQRLVYQSRSGRPEDPWLAPDILDCLRDLSAGGTKDIVVMPIGFLSDHMEVMYDLDIEARELCANLKLNLVRAKTVGTHPEFVRMIRELIQERLSSNDDRTTCGDLPASPDVCPVDCCPAPQRPKPRV